MLAAALNRLLDQSPAAAKALMPWSGRNVCIETPLMRMTAVLTDDGRMGQTQAEPEVVLHVPLAFFMARARDPAAASRLIDLCGDAELGEHVGHALALLHWDAAEDLSGLMGDVLASRLMRLAHLLRRLPESMGRRALLAGTEYWRDEATVLPRAEDVGAWQRAVDNLRDDLARLEKRIERME